MSPPKFDDLVVNYAALTPTTVLWWHTTGILLSEWVGDTESKLLVGFASCVVIACLHDQFRRNVPTESSGFAKVGYETAYDYLVAVTCSCYCLGVRAIYYHLARSGLFPGPLWIAAAAGVLLICLRGFRNVLALPIEVDNDDYANNRYRPVNNLTFFGGMMAARTLTPLNKLCERPPRYVPAHCKLTFDPLTLKVVSESHVTWAISLPILIFLGLSVLDLRQMYATDVRQTDARQKHPLMPPPYGGGGIIMVIILVHID